MVVGSGISFEVSESEAGSSFGGGRHPSSVVARARLVRRGAGMSEGTGGMRAVLQPRSWLRGGWRSAISFDFVKGGWAFRSVGWRRVRGRRGWE